MEWLNSIAPFSITRDVTHPRSGVRKVSVLYWTIPVWTLIGSRALFVHIGCTHML